VAGAQEHPAHAVEHVALAAPVAGEFLLAAAAHGGDDLVGQADGVELVDGDAGVRQGLAHSGVVARVGVEGDLDDGLAGVLAQSPQPVADQRLRASLDQVDEPAGV